MTIQFRDEDSNMKTIETVSTPVNIQLDHDVGEARPLISIQFKDKTPDTTDYSMKEFKQRMSSLTPKLPSIIIDKYSIFLEHLINLKRNLELNLPSNWRNQKTEFEYRDRLFDFLNDIPMYRNKIEKEPQRSPNRCDLIIDSEIIIEIKFVPKRQKPKTINHYISEYNSQLYQYIREREKFVGFLIVFANYKRVVVDPPHLEDITFELISYLKTQVLIVGIIIRCGETTKASSREGYL